MAAPADVGDEGDDQEDEEGVGDGGEESVLEGEGLQRRGGAQHADMRWKCLRDTVGGEGIEDVDIHLWDKVGVRITVTVIARVRIMGVTTARVSEMPVSYS